MYRKDDEYIPPSQQTFAHNGLWLTIGLSVFVIVVLVWAGFWTVNWFRDNVDLSELEDTSSTSTVEVRDDAPGEITRVETPCFEMDVVVGFGGSEIGSDFNPCIVSTGEMYILATYSFVSSVPDYTDSRSFASYSTGGEISEPIVEIPVGDAIGVVVGDEFQTDVYVYKRTSVRPELAFDENEVYDGFSFRFYDSDIDTVRDIMQSVVWK